VNRDPPTAQGAAGERGVTIGHDAHSFRADRNEHGGSGTGHPSGSGPSVATSGSAARSRRNRRVTWPPRLERGGGANPRRGQDGCVLASPKQGDSERRGIPPAVAGRASPLRLNWPMPEEGTRRFPDQSKGDVRPLPAGSRPPCAHKGRTALFRPGRHRPRLRRRDHALLAVSGPAFSCSSRPCPARPRPPPEPQPTRVQRGSRPPSGDDQAPSSNRCQGPSAFGPAPSAPTALGPRFARGVGPAFACRLEAVLCPARPRPHPARDHHGRGEDPGPHAGDDQAPGSNRCQGPSAFGPEPTGPTAPGPRFARRVGTGVCLQARGLALPCPSETPPGPRPPRARRGS